MTSNQISDLAGKAKVVPVADPPMTQKEKLTRWAALVRAIPCQLALFSNLEHWSAGMLVQEPPYLSAFKVAADDPKFRAAGLENSSPMASMKFFGLSQGDLHEFSCDCGGIITNSQMADRIDRIAQRGEPSSRSFFSLPRF